MHPMYIAGAQDAPYQGEKRKIDYTENNNTKPPSPDLGIFSFVY